MRCQDCSKKQQVPESARLLRGTSELSIDLLLKWEDLLSVSGGSRTFHGSATTVVGLWLALGLLISFHDQTRETHTTQQERERKPYRACAYNQDWDVERRCNGPMYRKKSVGIFAVLPLRPWRDVSILSTKSREGSPTAEERKGLDRVLATSASKKR